MRKKHHRSLDSYSGEAVPGGTTPEEQSNNRKCHRAQIRDRAQQTAYICAVLSAALGFVLGCSSETGTGPQEGARERAAPATEALGAAGATADDGPPQQEITIASLHYSQCTLHPDNSNESMSVYANDEGVVHLWAAPTTETKTFTLVCDEPNGSVQYKFDLADPSTFVPAVARVQSMDRTIRPALTNPDSLSQQGLTKAGYPPRPDKSASDYAQWLELVSQPVTLVHPRVIQTQEHRGSPTSMTSGNWVGLAIDYPGSAPYDTYTYVYSTFTVPTFSQQGTGTSYASPWVGLGGVYDGLIIQEGVDGISTGGVTSYKPWYEYFPDGLAYPMFTMNAGDSVNWTAYECDQYGGYGTSSHGYACFTWYDYTRHTGISLTIVPIPSTCPGSCCGGCTFTGNTCEGVIERVYSGGYPTYFWLSSWSSGGANIPFDCHDLNGWNTWNTYTDPYLNITMKNASNQTGATVAETDPDNAGFTWVRSH